MPRAAHIGDVEAKILQLNREKWQMAAQHNRKAQGMMGQRPQVQVLFLPLNELCDLKEVIYSL